MIKLLESANSDTNGLPHLALGASMNLAVWADDFGGGTVTFQGSPDSGVTWIDLYMINNVLGTFTVNTILQTQKLSQNLSLRAILTGSTSPVNVNAVLFD